MRGETTKHLLRLRESWGPGWEAVEFRYPVHPFEGESIIKDIPHPVTEAIKNTSAKDMLLFLVALAREEIKNNKLNGQDNTADIGTAAPAEPEENQGSNWEI